MSRRGFFKLIGKSIARAAAEFTYEVAKPDKNFTRPPGSGTEEEFLSLCKKCGKCVEACPSGILEKISDMNPIVFETPVMNFENGRCERCYLCIEACPSGALSKENLNKYRYVAKLLKDRCVAFQDIFCQSCYWSCPKMDKAITLKDFAYPEFHPEECLGCGSCLNACPTNPKSIEIVKVEGKKHRS